MARFFVGQKVRVVGIQDKNIERLVGKEGTVNELDCENFFEMPGYIGVTVDSCEDYCFLPHHIEPITDTYETTTWESMRHLWVPEHMREGV